MVTLNAEIREGKVKSAKLRRENYVPAILYGKHLAESIPLKLPLKETELYLKTIDVGSKVQVKIGSNTHQALIKELTRQPATGFLEHLSFMALSNTEKVKAVARIAIVGKDALMRRGVLLQTLDDIDYRALPSQLIDVVTVNVENMQVGDTIKVSDLDIAKDPNIEILNNSDTVIATLTPIKQQKIEEAGEQSAEEENKQPEKAAEKSDKGERAKEDK